MVKRQQERENRPADSENSFVRGTNVNKAAEKPKDGPPMFSRGGAPKREQD